MSKQADMADEDFDDLTFDAELATKAPESDAQEDSSTAATAPATETAAPQTQESSPSQPETVHTAR